MTSPPPRGMRAHGVAAGGAHLGEEGTIETLRRHLRELQGADIVQAAAKLTMWLEKPGRDPYGSAQADLATELFSEDLAASLRATLNASSINGGIDAIVSPGQLLALQKL